MVASVAVLAAPAIAVTAPAAPTGAAPAQSSTNACTGQSSPAAHDFLLPAWGDQGGWSYPQQYETIMGADIDGDGTGELLGRNAVQLQTYVWPAATTQMGPNPPGQWQTSMTRGPAMPEADWFFDPSVYSTLQPADVDGDGADEVFYRSTTGVEVYHYDSGVWSGPEAGPPWGDDNALDQHIWEEQYYGTIQAADIDGDGAAEILGRSGQGMQSWARQGDGSYLQLETAASPPVFPDDGTPTDWDNTAYALTIQTADVDGDGTAELLARGHDGLELYSFGVTDAGTGQGAWTQLAGSGPWSNGDGWDEEKYRSTVTTGDLDGDGKDEVVARGPYGLEAYGWGGTQWVAEAVVPTSGAPGVLTDAQGYGQPQYYATIQVAEVVAGAPARLLVRGPDGLSMYRLDTTTAAFTKVGDTLAQLSDANHWDQQVRYETIATIPVVAGAGEFLIARDATGLRTYQLVGSSWVDPSAGFPTWSDPLGAESPLKRAYGSLDGWLRSKLVIGPTQTVRSAFEDLGIGTDHLYEAIGNAQPSSFQHFTRDDWNQVTGTTQEWTQAVGHVRNYLGVGAGAGDQNLTELMLDTFVAGGSSTNVKDISDKFTSADHDLDAIIGDLIWGALGAISGGAFFADDVAVMTFDGAMSLSGSAVSAGMGSTNTNGKVSTKVSEVDDEMLSAFCAGVLFLPMAHGQIVKDLGQLTTMDQMTLDGPLRFTTGLGGSSWDDAMTAANTGTSVWIYQQFAAMDDHGWRTGYCESGKSCNVGFDDVAYPQPTDDGYDYKEIPTDGDGTPNCIFSSSGHVSGWGDVTGTLGVDPGQMIFQPYVPAARHHVGSLGSPYDDLMVESGRMGLLGWRISTHSCEL